LWAKCLTVGWQVVLHKQYLGVAVMGFRAGVGTVSVAQLLSGVLCLRRRSGKDLWLASFDVEKCYDTVLWFKVVGVVLGANEAAGTTEHLSKRLTKAEETSRRLRWPAGICGLLWKTVVLPLLHSTAARFGTCGWST